MSTIPMHALFSFSFAINRTCISTSSHYIWFTLLTDFQSVTISLRFVLNVILYFVWRIKFHRKRCNQPQWSRCNSSLVRFLFLPLLLLPNWQFVFNWIFEMCTVQCNLSTVHCTKSLRAPRFLFLQFGNRFLFSAQPILHTSAHSHSLFCGWY